MWKISANWAWIIVCSSVMLITGCASWNTKSLLERNQERLLLNEALFDAVENGRTDLVRDLVRQGADVDVRGIAGKNTPYPTKEWTPLLVASHKGYAKIAAILLENGANIHAQNYGTRTPLHVAAEKGHAEIVKMLIAKRADVHTTSSHDQWTPLHMAAYKGQTTVALILLEADADPFVKNIQGSTPLDYAKEKGLDAVVEAIEVLSRKP
jgi:ankyrin repeat protein